MKLKSFALFQAAVFVLLLARVESAFGQPEERTTKKQLEVEQRHFLVYIEDAENEYTNSLTRKARDIKLWENNVANAKIRLDVTFTLMDGNDKLRGHQAQIASLKKFFGEAKWVNKFTTNYFALRNRAYDLQNRLAPLMAELSPETRAFIEKQGEAIRNSEHPESILSVALGQVQGAEQQGKTISANPNDLGGPAAPPGDNVSPQTSVNNFFADMNDAAAADALRRALQSGPDPLSSADAQRAIDAARKGDIAALAALVHQYPGNETLRELLKKALLKAGLSPEEADRYARAARDGDSDTMNAMAANHPELGGRHSGETSTGPRSVVGHPPSDDVQYTTADGGAFDIRQWLDANGNVKDQTLIARYTDVKGGQIESEVIMDAAFSTVNAGKVVVGTKEEPKSKIEWTFTIKETKREKSGQGFIVTYELVNDGTPPNAAFDVNAWEGPDGKAESSDKKFTVTFPKPGKYEVRVYGTTGKYKSKFVIVLPCNF